MFEGRVIRTVDANADAFRLSLKSIPSGIQEEFRVRVRQLFGMQVDHIPASLHFHQLRDKFVPSRNDPSKKVPAWTLHMDAGDRYKASFTLEDMCIYFRTCGRHDAVDKKP